MLLNKTGEPPAYPNRCMYHNLTVYKGLLYSPPPPNPAPHTMSKHIQERYFSASAFFAFLLLFMGTTPAAAQDGEDTPRVGVGVALSDITTVLVSGISGGTVSAPVVLVPIDVMPGLRVEPILGYARTRSEITVADNEPQETSVSALQIGVGIFGRADRGAAGLYYGGRIGYTTSSADITSGAPGDDGESASGFFVGPTLGGSYFLSDFFSLGGDIEVRYTSTGREEDFGTQTAEYSNSSIIFRPSLVVRFFF